MLQDKLKRVASKLLAVFGVLLALYLTLSAAFYWAMRQPPDAFGRIMAHVPFPFMIVLPFETLWTHARAGTIQPGDQAPDFQLPLLDRTGSVRLSALRGARPVVLVFGSYT